MILDFASKPSAEFKDVRITTSNWGTNTLTMRQILYAAFDVVALVQCYPNFPPPSHQVKQSTSKEFKKISKKEKIKHIKKRKNIGMKRLFGLQ
jgi:ribonuclease D